MEQDGSVPLLPAAGSPSPDVPNNIPTVVSAAPKQPLFWEYLSEADRQEFDRIRAILASPACKHRRHHANEINSEILNRIKSFVVRNDADDWKRALVCGIYWMPDTVVINTRQLRLLLSKCKSSINALFQNLGYVTVPASGDFASSLIRVFPLLKDNFAELRKWTPRVRRLPSQADIVEPMESIEVVPTSGDDPLPPIDVKKDVE